MNFGTACSKLRSDLLFAFAVAAGHKCHRCGDGLTRETFSIEHIKPWLDSDDPAGLFFDLNNIAFSHRSCNIRAGRKTNKVYPSKKAANKASNDRRRDRGRVYNAAQRKAKYQRTGK